MTNLVKFMKHEMEPFDLLFRNFFDADAFFMPAINTETKYPVDIHENETALNFEIAVPGLNKQDIQIEEEDGVLRVSYEKKEEENNEGKHYIQRKIAKKAFNFGWKISDKFDLKQIEAEMDKGILRISIPKGEEKQQLKNAIEIK